MLPPADGIILRDAHPGTAVNTLRSIHPSVARDDKPELIVASLDPFNPKSGYNPNGPSSYSEAFKKAYFEGQAIRMNRLIELALAKLRPIEVSVHANDDAPFIVPRGDAAKLFQLDLSILHGTVSPRKLLKNDGAIDECCTIKSVRVAVPNIARQNAAFDGGTLFLTLRSFLSANAIRASNSLDGIDHCSSNNSTVCALQSISVPVLFGAMGGHYFIRDNEIHYEVAKSKDKDFITIEGATHGITPCVECETRPGQYSNSVRNFFDYVAKWVNARF